MTRGWNPSVLQHSLVSERVEVPLALVRGGEAVSLLSYQAPGPEQAIPMRLTLHAMARGDGQPLFTLPTSGPDAPRVAGFRAGWRRNPAGSADNLLSGLPCYVRVEWGVGGAPPNRLVADWPVMGASIGLTASRVKVDAIFDENVTSFAAGSQPAFAADLAPADQHAVMAYDGLSFVQRISDGDSVAVPEFARSLWVSGRLVDAGTPVGVRDGFEIQWGDSQGNSIAFGANDFVLAGESSRAQMLPVPSGAVMATVSVVTVGLLAPNVTLGWRIAP